MSGLDALIPNSYKLANYFVAYVDVMGVRSRLFSEIEKHSEGAIKLSSQTQQKIDTVSNAIATFFVNLKDNELFVRQKPREYVEYLDGGSLTAEQSKRLEEEVLNFNFGVQQFSDTTMFYIRDSGPAARVFFQQWMEKLGYEMIRAMGKEVFVRGTITYGIGWELGPSCLFGPVIQDAYEIEQNIANTFRIVVSSTFYKVASSHIRALARMGANMDKNFPFKMIERDPDGILSFDYLSTGMLQAYGKFCDWKKDELVESLTNAYNYCAREHKRILKQVDENQKLSKMVMKHVMFLSYLDDRLKQFKKSSTDAKL